MIFLLGRWGDGGGSQRRKKTRGRSLTFLFEWWNGIDSAFARWDLFVPSAPFIRHRDVGGFELRVVNRRMSRQLRKSKSYDTSPTNHSTEAIERSGENGDKFYYVFLPSLNKINIFDSSLTRLPAMKKMKLISKLNWLQQRTRLAQLNQILGSAVIKQIILRSKRFISSSRLGFAKFLHPPKLRNREVIVVMTPKHKGRWKKLLNREQTWN